MGTRALVRVFDEDNAEIICMYRQYDGYLSGLGKELVDFCASKRMVNGIPVTVPIANCANGIECLAAQIIAHFKKEAGNIYLFPPGTGKEFYVYHVRSRGEGKPIEVKAFVNGEETPIADED